MMGPASPKNNLPAARAHSPYKKRATHTGVKRKIGIQGQKKSPNKSGAGQKVSAKRIAEKKITG